MKNFFKYFLPMTATVVALSACIKVKEAENQIPAETEATLHITVKASPDEIKSDADTKTYIDNTTIKWGTGEYMKIGVYDGTGTAWGKSDDETADVWNGDTEAYFTFDITPANASGNYTYYGLYPESAASTSNNTDPASYKVILPATQSATVASYDPKAYILVARPESGKTLANADWNAWFRRATALNKITLSNLPEDIKRVKITVPDGTYLAGGRHIDLTTGLSGDIYSGGGRTETVEVRFASKQSHESPIVVWFTSWDAAIPVGDNLTIVAFSDAHTYTRTLTVVNKSITFKEGYLNTLKVNMSTAVEGDNTELDEGDYLILANNNGTYYALKAAAEGSRMDYEDYSGSTSSYSGDADIIWTVSKSGDVYTIENDSKYLGWSSGNTATLQAAGEGWTETNYGMDIMWDGENSCYHVNVHDDQSRILAKNTGTYGFAYYTGSGYSNLLFVPATVDNRTPVTLSFEDDEQNEKDAVDLTTANCGSFLGLNLVSSENVTAVKEHIAWSYEDNDGVIDEFADGALTLTGNVGTATVTASFAGDGSYRPATASYTITVTSASISGWVETDLADITSDDVFVMVGNGAYALSSGGGTSTNPPAVAVTVSNGKITAGIVDAIKWNLTGNSEDGYTFYPNGLTTKLFCNTNAASGSNTNLRVGTGGSYNRYVFVLDEDHLVTHDEYTARYIGINGTSDFRGYVAKNTNSVTFKFYKYVDSRPSPEMSWSSDAATATYSTGNSLDFSSPTLTPGNATGITYESTDATIATINNAGVVSITALTANDVKEGSTTIKAIFAGDGNYMAQTVSYTLTVVDSRDAVATPTFSPAAGEVAADTEVTISYADGATVYYTVDNSTPTSSSTEYTGAITIDVTKTIKAIATKTGYKPSAVAEAAYTVAGVAAKGTEANPYTASEAYDAATASPVNDVYVKGIVSAITTAYNAQYQNVTFTISDDGLTTGGKQFTAFREKSSYSSTVAVGDCVIIKGNLQLYNSTPELLANNAIQSSLSMPAFTTGDENFVTSTTVTLSAAGGATIYYTDDGTTPTTNSSVYSSALNLNATTTIKAIAEKDGLITGVASRTFNKVAAYAVTFGTPANGTITVKHGETTLSTGDTVPAGETVSITATPADGYQLATLVYNAGGGDVDIKSSKSFTMPAHSVSITATFEQSGGSTPDPIVLNKDTDGFRTGSYGTANAFDDATLEGYSFKIQQVYVNNSKLQWRASGNKNGTGIMYNADAMPSGITSIVIVYNSSDTGKNHTVKIGSSANPTSSSTITPSVSGLTYTFAGDGSSTYFVITNGSGAGYIDSITINFN